MNSLIKKLSIRHGLLIGGISAALTIVFYIINPVLQYTSLLVGLLSIVIMIALLVILGLDIRRKTGGYWNFGQAYLSLLIMSVLICLISIVISFVIFKFVDPSLPQKVTDATLQVTTQRLESMGMDQDKIDEATKSFTDGEMLAKFQPTFFNEIKNFGIGVLIYAVINLIIAACIKKNPPMFASVTDAEVIE